MPTPSDFIIPCDVSSDFTQKVREYAEDLRETAHTIGDHGMTQEAFAASGLFRAAVERLRGQNAATMSHKRAFIEAVLRHMAEAGAIGNWSFTGTGDRHDYRLSMPDGKVVVFEAKGCLDGNNTNIFSRPPNAEEFYIWSLCQNPGSNPRRNAWSGVHVRLGANIIATNTKIDGLIIWDMLCGTIARPCPKVVGSPERVMGIAGYNLPPPCIYLFPVTIPDPRSNPAPRVRSIDEASFLKSLSGTFGCRDNEAYQVGIEARMRGAALERKTVISRGGNILTESGWTALRRVAR